MAVTYSMNRLQGIPSPTPVLVTLNRHDDIDPARVLDTFEYDHPVLRCRGGAGTGAATARSAAIEGTSFAGAYWGYGFHEDGVQSALRVCRALGVEPPW